MSIYQARVAKTLLWGWAAMCGLESAIRHDGAWRFVFAALTVFNVVNAADVFSQRFDRAEREEA
jgi:4-hydroxybenzoate polyprenyltransferase